MNILICLNKLDIGGLETSVLAQTRVLSEKKYNIIILAEPGIYKEQFEKISNVKVINFKYDLLKDLTDDDLDFLENVIVSNNINYAIIHQPDCICYILPVLIKLSIPYAAYLHNGIPGITKAFEENYPKYYFLNRIFYKNADKLIAITESAMKENMKLYGIDKEKYIVKNNSIDFEKFSPIEYQSKNISKFCIVTRFSEEKKKTIDSAINIFLEYNKKVKSTLTIIGDGVLLNKYKDELKSAKNITFLGARNDVATLLKNCDVVLSVDRCILEALAMKRIAIICGYDGTNAIVTRDKIIKARKENFSGRGISGQGTDEIVNVLLSYSLNDIKKMTESNYKYVYKNLNIENNVYFPKKLSKIKNFDNKDYAELIVMAETATNATTRRFEKIYNDSQKANQFYVSKIKTLEKLLEEKKESLFSKFKRKIKHCVFKR